LALAANRFASISNPGDLDISNLATGAAPCGRMTTFPHDNAVLVGSGQSWSGRDMLALVV